MKLNEITVLVPTRNEARNISTFLRSLPADIALIVVDASEDDTRDIIAAERTQRTLVLQRPGSVTEARQLAAEVAQTDWLLFTDGDVVFSARYFTRVRRYDAFDLVYGPKLSGDAFRRYYCWFARAQGLADRIGIPAATGSSLLIRRQVLWHVGWFDRRLRCNEDSELGWRVKRKGHRVLFDASLAVLAKDHRRLRQGRLVKTLHSVARCAPLYTNLMPARWRTHDWGYWSHRQPDKATS